MKTKNIVFTFFLVILIAFLGYVLLNTPLPNQPPVSGEKSQAEAIATIYAKDPATREFNIWNGQAFAQNNPLIITEEKGLSVILPAGEYYVKVESLGYDTITSLVTEISEQSVVTAKINLGRKNTLWSKMVAIFSLADDSNNFSLTVTPLPPQSLMPIGEFLPVITAYDTEEQEHKFFNKPYDKPVIVYVFSAWNTKAKEQMDIFVEIHKELADDYIFVPLSTLEPIAVNQTKIKRGNYDLEFYRPSDRFYDDYKIISLPQFFLANNKGELVSVITGSRSAGNLVEQIIEAYK